jgi:hypothetical protein
VARNFQSDLNKGVLGEQLFLKLFRHVQQLDGRKGDLAVDGHKIELKCDFYGLAKSQNFFMERYGAVETLTDGGPWKALKDGCEYFVYFYAHDFTGYVWRTTDLVKQLEELTKALTPVEVRNKSWTTIGYKVPRSSLRPGMVFEAKDLHVHDESFNNIGSSWGFKAFSR